MQKYLHIWKKSCTFAAQNCKNNKKCTIMAVLEREAIYTNMPVVAGIVGKRTISDKKWNSLHTIEELDAALETIIEKSFKS